MIDINQILVEIALKIVIGNVCFSFDRRQSESGRRDETNRRLRNRIRRNGRPRCKKHHECKVSFIFDLDAKNIMNVMGGSASMLRI